MNIFMLGTDKTLVGAPGVGDAPERHRRYGEHVEHLDIVVATARHEGLTVNDISPTVRAYPSNSLLKPLFFFDALRIFKQVLKRHPVDLVVTQDPFLLGFTGWWLKKRYGVKLAVSFHGDFWENPSWLRERFINRFLVVLSYGIVPRADAVRAVSEVIKKKVAARIGSAAHIRVIPTPVAFDQRSVCESNAGERVRNHYGGRPIVLFVGRLTEVKNVPFLLRAWKRVEETNGGGVLVVIGDGPKRSSLEVLRDHLRLQESVFFVGRLDHGAVFDYYQAADLVVLPSLSEGLPKVLVEAAFAGKPLIGTNVGGISEVIEENGNGFLIPLGDEAYFAGKMFILLKDEPLRKRMGTRSRQIAEERFGDTTSKLIAFWSEVVGMQLSKGPTSKDISKS